MWRRLMGILRSKGAAAATLSATGWPASKTKGSACSRARLIHVRIETAEPVMAAAAESACF